MFEMSVYEMDLNVVQIFVDCVGALVNSVLVCQLPIPVREVSNTKSDLSCTCLLIPVCKQNSSYLGVWKPIWLTEPCETLLDLNCLVVTCVS